LLKFYQGSWWCCCRYEISSRSCLAILDSAYPAKLVKLTETLANVLVRFSAALYGKEMKQISIPELLNRSERLKTLAHEKMGQWPEDVTWAKGARDCLEECLGGVSFDPIDLLEASMFREGPRPTFLNLSFSQHPLTLWSSDDMSLDVYYWRPGETTLHDHGFHGAFMPVVGEYAEVVYDFKLTEDLGRGLELGVLTKIRDQELLTVGKATAIFHAPLFIHQVTHQSYCVTLCLRSRFQGREISDYFFPGIKVAGNSVLSISAREDLQRLAILQEMRPEKVLPLIAVTPLGTLGRWWLKDLGDGQHRSLKPLIREELLKRPHGQSVLAATL
jgi:hypothetical protein